VCSVAARLVSFVLRSRSAAFVVVLMLVAGGAARAAPEPPPPEADAPAPPTITFRDGRLSVEATDVPTMALLARIGSVTGATVSGTVTDPATVTVTFHDAPMRQAIDRIVRNNSFTLRYGKDGSLRRIALHGPDGYEPPPTAANLRGRRRFQRAWLSHPRMTLDGTLATALGLQQIKLPRLLRSVRKVGDRGLRRKIAITFTHTVEASADLRRPWGSMTPPELATLMKQQTGIHAREVLTDIAAATRSARTRAHARKALAILSQERPAKR